jgi:hypothetical protein
MYLNRLTLILTLIGFIGANAESKTRNAGSKLAVFSVATKRSWKNADGGWELRTEWHRCLAFGKLGANGGEENVKRRLLQERRVLSLPESGIIDHAHRAFMRLESRWF